MLKKIGKTNLIYTTFIIFILVIIALALHAYSAGKSITVSTTPTASATHRAAQASKENLPVTPAAWQQVTIKPGDTLRGILIKNHIQKRELQLFFKGDHSYSKKLIPGQTLRYRSDKGQLLALQIPINNYQLLTFTRAQDHFVRQTNKLPITKGTLFKTGIINSSVADACQRAGLTNRMYQQLVTIFQGKVNFSHDIHRGDRFAILHDEYFINNHKLRAGDIVAAELITQNKTYQAFRFSYPDNHMGYYTPGGNNVEHLFLSYPVQFKRISSTFSKTRLDPVVHKVRPHLGIDFAAKSGTPIRSIGSGRVIFVGKDHGYGNAIKINYDQRYTALYAHMSRFAKDLKVHQYIQKGQIIGYVGATGWATGPHLHFGFFVNGVAKNWLALEKPNDLPIPRKYYKKFSQQVEALSTSLELHQATAFAANDTQLVK